MNNDLISREALKEALQHRSECGPDCTGMCCVDCFCDLIDNAPTVPQVTVFTEDADETAVADLKAELQNVLDSDRPQGEWRDNLIEVFRQAAEVGGDTFHLFEIERIINGEPI